HGAWPPQNNATEIGIVGPRALSLQPSEGAVIVPWGCSVGSGVGCHATGEYYIRRLDRSAVCARVDEQSAASSFGFGASGDGLIIAEGDASKAERTAVGEDRASKTRSWPAIDRGKRTATEAA